MSTPSAADPRPQPPDKPLPQECCESGCPICVYDLYAEALEGYRQALAAWERRHASDADDQNASSNATSPSTPT